MPRTQHEREIARGERFQFGRNWVRFLKILNDERIAIATRSLQSALRRPSLSGLTFLDIGSGSGLFSLCARRLGAKVRSFDFDPQSVACTNELKCRFFPNDPDWVIESGSILDFDYVKSLGQFDIVYSWGVLHHTGQMWQGITNLHNLVAIGGTLYIAIYNDLGPTTDRWAEHKRRYNLLPEPLKTLYALWIISNSEFASVKSYVRHEGLRSWIRTWTDYSSTSSRGMSKWHDWIDWIGGYPYERASIETVVDYLSQDGYKLINLVDRSDGYGCNEFVFRREAPLGTWIENRIPSDASMARAYGTTLTGTPHRRADGWYLPCPTRELLGSELFLFEGSELRGRANLAADGCIRVATIERELGSGPTPLFRVVPALEIQSSNRFALVRGKMWCLFLPELSDMADSPEHPKLSRLFMFERGKQLVPHSLHDTIAQAGHGHYSHWGTNLYFAPLNHCDPNVVRGDFTLLVSPLPAMDRPSC